MKRFFTLTAFLLLTLAIRAEDTLTVMHYNLLYYAANTSFCTNENNNLDEKNIHLKVILDAVRPDIFTVNEISALEVNQLGLMENTLNVNGVNYYQKAAPSNQAGSGIVNMMYYDSRKLRLKTQHTAQSYIRDIDVYELYYISDDLAQGDTSFVVCAVAHLKSGNSNENEAKRKIMAENAMAFLEARYATENVLFMGDFNVYSGSDDAYQTITNYSNAAIRFIDPIDQSGNWNNNSAFAAIHTQSTNSSSNGCAASGGMDDRFDFILVSDEVRFGTKSISYIEDSYKAFGQDGLHYNSSIAAPPANAVVSEEVAYALQNMSDHLPVVLQLHVDKTLDIYEQQRNPFLAGLLNNPVADLLRLSFYQPTAGSLVFNLYNTQGQLIKTDSQGFATGKQQFSMNLTSVPAGFYLLQLTNERGLSSVMKVMVR
ncbi:MAG: T9SS type A sorting domain-containing protein [Bacteroidales bacterium]|jgi:endonuclease/exonuclease/phosphatase family metal-dependent hydrolase|nr:T9SS type A sorting domain-containing protein [Bacteroidales bacterium]